MYGRLTVTAHSPYSNWVHVHSIMVTYTNLPNSITIIYYIISTNTILTTSTSHLFYNQPNSQFTFDCTLHQSAAHFHTTYHGNPPNCIPISTSIIIITITDIQSTRIDISSLQTRSFYFCFLEKRNNSRNL